QVTLGPGLQSRARWSGDAQRLVFAAEDLTFDVWLQPLDSSSGAARGEARRLTDQTAQDLSPSVSWDGAHIAFVSHRSGLGSLRTRDGSGDVRAVLTSSVTLLDARLSGDGSRILYTDAGFDLLSIPSSGGTVQKLCEHCGSVMGASNDG